MRSVYTLTPETLSRLDPHEAVETLRDLLWAQARRRGVNISKIHVASEINVADGGVDQR